MVYNLNFYTSFHQIYLRDKEFHQKTDEQEFWTNTAYDSRLAIGNGVLGVGLECYGRFRGELTLLNRENAIAKFDQFDHVVEGGIYLRSGVLQVIDCPNSNIELELKLVPKRYRVRIYSSNLSSVRDDSGDDYYNIEIWPDENMELKVLKHYSSYQ